jgi:hypothetical protein
MHLVIRAGLLFALTAAAIVPARAEPGDAAAWLDDPAIQWNEPGAAIPAAPRPMAVPEYCAFQVREPETDADRQVTAAGWRLILGYEAGWGVTIVRATGGFDANCRPAPYSAFVFVDGEYAGRLTPAASWPRTDGALVSATMSSGGNVLATYDRYGPTTPLCCPEGSVQVVFTPERTADGPVVRAKPERLRFGPDGRWIPPDAEGS